MGGYFDNEGCISEYGNHLVMELCEDNSGIVSAYVCTYNVKTNSLQIEKRYKFRFANDGISDSQWDLMKEQNEIIDYDFGDSEIIEVKIKDDKLYYKGMIIEENNEFVDSNYSYQIK